VSSIVKTEAVVLRSLKYRETSKIVTFYTRDFGKLKGIAKGACHPKNKFGAALEPATLVCLVLYKKDVRDIQVISQCDVVQSWHRLAEDVEKMAVALSTVELVDKVSHGEEENEELFKLVVEVLGSANAATKNAGNLLPAFEIRLARILGFAPKFGNCSSCGARIDCDPREGIGVPFHFAKGGPLCSKCSTVPGLKVKVKAVSLHFLQQLARVTPIGRACELDVPRVQRSEIAGLMLGYLRFHVEGLHGLKTERVFSRMLSTAG
jgi:DNA repair protein RecO (recombination protein O)